MLKWKNLYVVILSLILSAALVGCKESEPMVDPIPFKEDTAMDVPQLAPQGAEIKLDEYDQQMKESKERLDAIEGRPYTEEDNEYEEHEYHGEATPSDIPDQPVAQPEEQYSDEGAPDSPEAL